MLTASDYKRNHTKRRPTNASSKQQTTIDCNSTAPEYVSIDDMVNASIAIQATESPLSPTSLAHIGDVVYEMCIRCRYVWPSRRTSDLQNVVVAKVRGKTDLQCFQCWVFTPVSFC